VSQVRRASRRCSRISPENPFYGMPPKFNPQGEDWVDYGLGGFLAHAGFDPEVYEPQLGKQKVPSLRNVDLRPSPDFVKAYGHNGYFKSLEEITHFYNTRDVEFWPPPEVAETVSTELGNLGLTLDEEAAIVAFMRTLSDGYVP
jgi:cytochrome c peroxidase